MQLQTKKLYSREDSRRMAHTLLQLRREQGEKLPEVSTRRMQRLPAQVLATFAARPAALRTVQLAEVKNGVVTFRLSAGR